MKKSAWHSSTSDTYHVCTNCTAGSEIEPENLRQGTGNRPLCKECQRLLNRGSC